MRYDAALLLDDDAAITVSRASTNVIKVGTTGNKGEGSPVYAKFQVTEAFTAAGAATLTLVVQKSTDEAFSSPIVAVQSGAIGKADLVAGKTISLVIPKAESDELYYRAYYTVGTGPMTAGKILSVLDRNQ